MDNSSILLAVANTLGLISVRGKDDCDRMAGCIKAIETIADSLSKEPKEESDGKQGD